MSFDCFSKIRPKGGFIFTSICLLQQIWTVNTLFNNCLLEGNVFYFMNIQRGGKERKRLEGNNKNVSW